MRHDFDVTCGDTIYPASIHLTVADVAWLGFRQLRHIMATQSFGVKTDHVTPHYGLMPARIRVSHVIALLELKFGLGFRVRIRVRLGLG